MTAVDEAAARLTEQVPSRTVFSYAVPDGTLPARYLLVSGSPGSEESARMGGTVNLGEPFVWVTSVSRNAKPEVAAREAAWGAQKAREALRNYRPDGTWSFRAETSQAPQRDDSLDATTFYAVEQFSRRTFL
jgi:hypothetical protein